MSIKECALYALVVALSTVVKWSVSLNSYSGAGKPPMFGDYEAQRHWMEITYNLPTTKWYMNSTENDLQYWGLDYPPLTAYHSWLCGLVACRFNSSWVELLTSRGFESPQHKLFMRYTVLVADLMVFVPAVFLYMFGNKNLKSAEQKLCAVLVILLYPGLILIDYGHFQYNCVSLGFALLAVHYICAGRELLGSVMFCLALNYKQMELYHAAPFFFYLLGHAVKNKTENWFVKLCKLGCVVVLSFGLCWLPFLTDPTQAAQVLHRLFPFARGIFEDKVASFWCVLSAVIKLKNLLSQQKLVLLCLATTTFALLPSSIHLLLKPSTQNFKYALVNSALVFFLFSFQVHEKSILLAALPVCILLNDHPAMGLWFLHISTFSMLPLLRKDGQLLATLGTSLLFHIVTTSVYNTGPALGKASTKYTKILPIIFSLSMSGCAMLWLLFVSVPPPARLPDIWPLLISFYSCAHLITFLLYTHWLQFTTQHSTTNKLKDKKRR